MSLLSPSFSSFTSAFLGFFFSSFFFPLSCFCFSPQSPTIWSTCDSGLPPPGDAIGPAGLHSILGFCLFNPRRSCLARIGHLRSDAERFPIDGLRRRRAVKELKVKGEEAKSMGEQSVLVQTAPGRQFTSNGNKQGRMELKRLQWRAGDSFFMRDCTVL